MGDDEAKVESPNNVMGALAGGALMGVPSALPCIGICCMLWGVLGGVLGAWIASQRAREYRAGDGAVSGLCAAGAGWLAYSIINVPLQLIMRVAMGQQAQQLPPNLPPEFRPLVEALQGPLGILVGEVMILGIFLVTGAIGGLIGGLVFKKEPQEF